MRRWIIAAAAAAAIAPAGCKRAESDATPEAPTARRPAADAGDEKGTPMTSSSDPWEKAKAIAATALPGKTLKKLSDELPYYFYAGSSGVLVHQGKVVTGRGVEVAADYLRDIGIVEGPKPSVFQTLQLLAFLEALPEVQGFAPDGYYPPAGPNPDAFDGALGARIEREPGVARIVLSYLAPRSRRHPGGAPSGPAKRRVTRATLNIDKAPAKWTIETIEWTPPHP